jgi:hypothetical protein
MDAKFAHRHNPDGSVDSICLQCFRTVVTTRKQADRLIKEDSHVCDGMDLGAILHPESERRRDV